MSENYDITFGVWVKRLRAQLDLTQDALAEQVGCAVETLRSFERGVRRPSRMMVERLADVLKVPAGERAAFLRLGRAVEIHSSTPRQNHSDNPPAPEPRSRLAPPPQVVDLIGRTAEREQLIGLLRAPGPRLVSLIGPGGIGKTSLALQVATELAADETAFADGAGVVWLASVAKAGDAPLAIAEMLGYATQSARPVADLLVEALRERSLLVVLDNLEHLLGADSELLTTLIRRLLTEAPSVRLLATSRERLRLRDERVIELGGLTIPPSDTGPRVDQAESVQLFVERAQHIAPEFALRPENRAAIAHICRRLEGLPLAIELAAAWTRAITPREIAAEIDRAVDFLEVADRDAVARHRSVRAVLDHSWTLLTADERRTLARLSVFHGGCDREAAAAVISSEFRVLSSDQDNSQLKTHNSKLITQLAALIDKSLVRRHEVGGVTRYTLHELVRQYAAERLADDPADQAATEARHTTYYAALLQRLIESRTGAATTAARATLNRELDNLRAAWLRAAATQDTAALATMFRGFWVLYEANGWVLDGAALYGQAAEALRATASAAGLRGYLMVQQGAALSRIGRFAQADPLIEEGMALAQSSEDIASLSDLPFNLGMIELNRGRITAAQTLLGRATSAAHAAGDHFVRLWAELFLGWIARMKGDYSAAEAAFQTCLAAWRAQGFARGEAIALVYLGELARITGRYEACAAYLSASMRIASSANDRWTLSLTLGALGSLAIDQDEWDEAGYLLAESTSIIRDMGGEPWLLGAMLCARGQLARVRGALREALQYYAEVAQMVRTGEGLLAGDLVYGLARLHERAGDDETALALLDALEHTITEHYILRLAAERRAAIEGRLAPAKRAAAAETARERALLPWLEELCARPIAAEPPAPPATPIVAPAVPVGSCYVAETGETLTPREVEVLRLLIAGAGNQAIADTLVISLYTAKHHVASILQKLGVATRTQAALRGRALGLELPPHQ
jgi:predicted ATPase/DNA-binding CsgD family transcriptional regulator/transcriptional regulator with XRE-family HTH domain